MIVWLAQEPSTVHSCVEWSEGGVEGPTVSNDAMTPMDRDSSIMASELLLLLL